MDVELKVREAPGILQGSACAAGWVISFTGMRKTGGGGNSRGRFRTHQAGDVEETVGNVAVEDLSASELHI